MRGRLRSTWRWLGLGLGLGCGPAVGTPDDGSTGTTAVATTETDSPSETTGPPPDTSADVDSTSTGGLGEDEALCVQWCLNAEARGCAEGFYDEDCYTYCLGWLEPTGECDAESRAVIECEAQAGPPATPLCESLECEDVYKRDDLCRGWCAHLDGYPGSSASQTTCEWRSTCYGHEFEASCPVNDAAGVCTCTSDGQEIAQCEAGVAYGDFECGGEEVHVLLTCCREAFEGVLFP